MEIHEYTKGVKKTKSIIQHQNILAIRKKNYLDLIVTSPPYVTSYEYADLHQLSSLWLGYTNDYKTLRKNSIGSSYNREKMNYYKHLNGISRTTVDLLVSNRKLHFLVSRYYYQMKKVVEKSFKLLKDNGISIFVVGDTQYKGVKIQNARSLIEMMMESGYKIIEISKRRVNNKYLPSFRDDSGRFSSKNNGSKKIYSQEYIIVGRKES